MKSGEAPVNDAEDLLERHGVRPTANRISIVRALAASSRPLSMTELEDLLSTIDKSNIFRTLMLFRDRHLVHAIEDGSENVRYEICHSGDADPLHDDDRHCHFYCERCHRTFCLEKIPVPEVVLPRGYEAHSANFVIKGICPACGKAAD